MLDYLTYNVYHEHKTLFGTLWECRQGKFFPFLFLVLWLVHNQTNVGHINIRKINLIFCI